MSLPTSQISQGLSGMQLEIWVESTADIRYTATRNAQGPLPNLQTEAFTLFPPRSVADDFVCYSLAGLLWVVASPGTRSGGARKAGHPVVSERSGGFFLPWTVPGG